jgi:hypothetical protein
MRRLRVYVGPFLLIAALAVVSASDAGAQHLRYKTKTKMNLEFLGFLGSLLDSEMVEEVSINGNVKRVDRKDASTITNLDTEQVISLNHKRKEYSVITFDEMVEMFKAATAYGDAKLEEAQADLEEMDESSEYKVTFDLRVEDTGKSKKVAGNKADQKVLIIETVFEPEDEAAADSLPSTALYAVNDIWLSDNVPEMRVNDEFNQKMGEIAQEEFTQSNMSTVISALLKSDPRVSEAMEKAQDGINELEGTTLLSVMHIVTVPPDMELDLELALGEKEKPKKKGGGFGSFLKDAAKAQGVNVGDDDEKSDDPPEQMTLFSMESRTEDISDKSRNADYYQIPNNYKEVEFELPQIMGQTDAQ